MFGAVICSVMFLGAGVESWVPEGYRLRNFGEHVFPLPSGEVLPLVVPAFEEQVRGAALVGVDQAAAMGAKGIALDGSGKLVLVTEGGAVKVSRGKETWEGTTSGLFVSVGKGPKQRHEAYGVGGPLSTEITGLAVGADDALWVGTPLGLSRLGAEAGAEWTHFQGRDGMPVEQVTALAAGGNGDVWIGTPQGAILFRPEAPGRKWFYRQGKRYLPNDEVRSIAIAEDGKTVYFLTGAGVSTIELKDTTLLQKANAIELRLNERHRREGMVAASVLDDAENPTSHTIHDNDNDGLWTAYHVAAMSLAYGATKDAAAKSSAKEGMHALYMLQDASGIPGLVARSVVPPEIGKTKDAQW
jgi:hypothetical protein